MLLRSNKAGRTGSTGARRGKARVLGSLTLALALAGGSLAASPAQAADNPFERGPAPSNSSIEASTGSFSIKESAIIGQSGFGGGRLYYPSDTSKKYGVVVIVPGFMSVWAQLSWMGKRIASQGFVVVGIETKGLFDMPNPRGDQAIKALDWAINSSPAKNIIDKDRQAAAGWSMGGGGMREAARDRPSLKAIVPLAPWTGDSNWSSVKVPTMVITGSSDLVASPMAHGKPFYNSLPLGAKKAYLEINGQGHFFPTSSNKIQAKYMISWLKRFVDNDTRYNQFLCPGPGKGGLTGINDWKVACPM